MDLSTKMGNRVLKHFEKENLVCPPILRQKLFTSAALDNIDHDPSSTTAEDSFHGTGISLFQHHTSEQHGIDNGVFLDPLPDKKQLSPSRVIYRNPTNFKLQRSARNQRLFNSEAIRNTGRCTEIGKTVHRYYLLFS